MKLSPEDREKPNAIVHANRGSGGFTYPQGLSPEERAKRDTDYQEKLIENQRTRWAELEKQPTVRTCTALREEVEAILTSEAVGIVQGYGDLRQRYGDL